MKKGDYILGGIILAIGIVAMIYISSNKVEGNRVIVTVNNQEYKELPLNKDATLEIKGDYGINLLQIKDGKADIVEATCKDGVCVHSRAISNQDETIICLPNKVIVKVVGDSNQDIIIDGMTN